MIIVHATNPSHVDIYRTGLHNVGMVSTTQVSETTQYPETIHKFLFKDVNGEWVTQVNGKTASIPALIENALSTPSQELMTVLTNGRNGQSPMMGGMPCLSSYDGMLHDSLPKYTNAFQSLPMSMYGMGNGTGCIHDTIVGVVDKDETRDIQLSVLTSATFMQLQHPLIAHIYGMSLLQPLTGNEIKMLQLTLNTI